MRREWPFWIIGLAAAVFVAFNVYSVFRAAIRPEALAGGTKLMPPRLNGYRAVQTMAGKDALEAIQQLHGQDIPLADAYYVVYRLTNTNQQALLWVAASDSPAEANGLNQTMLQKMAVSTEFVRPDRDRNLAGEVYTTTGQGAVHWFGVYGKSVYWLALPVPADSWAAKPILEAVWAGLPTASAVSSGTTGGGSPVTGGPGGMASVGSQTTGASSPGPTASASPSATNPMGTATTGTPAAGGPAPDKPPAPSFTEQQVVRANSANAVEIQVLLLNTLGKEKPDTLSFYVGFTTHSVNLSQYDLAKLVSVRDKDGRTLSGLTWVSESDDSHHRSGFLKVANQLDGKPFATAKSGSISLVLKGIADVPTREFSWVGEYLATLGEGR